MFSLLEVGKTKEELESLEGRLSKHLPKSLKLLNTVRLQLSVGVPGLTLYRAFEAADDEGIVFAMQEDDTAPTDFTISIFCKDTTSELDKVRCQLSTVMPHQLSTYYYIVGC